MIVLRIEYEILGLKPHTFLALRYQMHLSPFARSILSRASLGGK